MKVCITPKVIPENTGIGRVVWAQRRILPRLGFELTDDPLHADVVAVHANRPDYISQPDVVMSHGIYWTGDVRHGDGWTQFANTGIVASYRRARAVTVPSEWVAEPFRRDMHLNPVVIPHGVDFDAWKPGTDRGYLLWNKSRPDPICDPQPAYELAARGLQVIATFAPDQAPLLPSLRITGQVDEARMKELVSGASIYLATTKETFGIATLEAMAAGVPVLGYRWGATPDLVTHKINGYLVKPGDVDGLAEGYEWLKANRKQAGEAARDTARRYTWDSAIAKYADLYRRLYDGRESGSGVSIVIANYNYARFLGAAIESCTNQTVKPHEIIVVDDGSTDNSLQVLEGYKDRVKVIAQANAGVAAARNAGIAAATGEFVISLDADDMLRPTYIEALLPAMQKDRGLGVAYTGLYMIHEDGSDRGKSAFPPEFSWDVQATVQNPPADCVPCAAMFRREMWVRAGGYKQDYAPAEDAEFWTRGLSRGFEAQRVTDDGLFLYRVKPGGAHVSRPYRPIDAWHPWMRDKAYPMAAPASAAPPVFAYDDPQVAVILDRPDLNTSIVNDADKLEGQTYRHWQATAVTHQIPACYPWLRKASTLYKAVQRTTAPLVVITRGLDWQPGTLEALVNSAGQGYRLTAKSGMLVLSSQVAKRLNAKTLEDLMGNCCGGNADAILAAKRAIGEIVPEVAAAVPPKPAHAPVVKVRLEFTGLQVGPILFKGLAGRRYEGANTDENRYVMVHPDDVPRLLSTEQWKLAA